jgi:hypothetical protein
MLFSGSISKTVSVFILALTGETKVPIMGKIRLFCISVMNASNPIVKVYPVLNYLISHSAESLSLMCCVA